MSLLHVEASSKKVPSRRAGTKSTTTSSSKAMKAKMMGTYYNGPFDFEIVGLYKNTYGRSCNLHTKCGEHLHAGDAIQLVPIETNTKNNQNDDDANENEDPVEGTIKVMKLVNDIPQCIVGYIPTVQCNVLKRKHGLFQTDNDDMSKNKKPIVFAIVNDIYQYSNNTYKVFTSERHYGMASCRFCTENTTTTTTTTSK